MRYLKCIALLKFLQQKLHIGQRVPVPVSTVDELMTSLVNVQKILKENDPDVERCLNDLMGSIGTIKETNGLQNIPDKMRTVLIDGLEELVEVICMKAYYYFQTNDFEPTEQIIIVMREVVKVAIKKGVLN